MVRSAVALALVTRQAVCVDRIRAGRPGAGLRPQHVVAIEAAAMIGKADLEGATEDSERIVFRPKTLHGGSFRVSAKGAGSATLIAEMLVSVLMHAPEPSELTIEGGTHVNLAPTYEFFADAYLYAMRRMGADVRAELVRAGFAPQNDGTLRVFIKPSPLRVTHLLERGRLVARRAVGRATSRNAGRAKDTVDALTRRLPLWSKAAFSAEPIEADSQGDVLAVTLRYAEIAEVVTCLGAPGVAAHQSALQVADPLDLYLAKTAPVGGYLADQLVVPMVLAGGGSFRTLGISEHTENQLTLVEAFFPKLKVTRREQPDGTWTVSLSPG